jgi:hypothetical protein
MNGTHQSHRMAFQVLEISYARLPELSSYQEAGR